MQTRRCVDWPKGCAQMNGPVMIDRRRRGLAGNWRAWSSASRCRMPSRRNQAAHGHSSRGKNLRAKPWQTAPLPRFLDPPSTPTARSTVFTGKAELGQGFIKTAFSRSRPKSSTFPSPRLKVITADTSRTVNEGYTSGSHSMQDSGHPRSSMPRPTGRATLLVAEAARAARSARRKISAPTPPPVIAPGRPALRVRRSGRGRHAACRGPADLATEGFPRPFKVMGQPVRRVDIPAKGHGAVRPMSRTCACRGWCNARVVRPPS